MEVKAVVFDVGETLINESRQWRMWAEWLGVSEQVFFSTLRGVIEQGQHQHHRRVFEILRPGFNLEAAIEQRRRAGNPDQFEATDLYEDALDCLDRLRERGFRVAVAANQPAGIQERLKLPVEFIASSSEWGVEKPSPEFFQKIIAEMRLPAEAIAYVGDRLDNDVLPARAAGMISVFIRRGLWGTIHATRPEVSEAHVRIETLSELPDVLGRWNGTARDYAAF